METALVPRNRRLTRTASRKVFAGVCSGLARFTGLNRWVFRAIFVGATLATGGAALLFYFLIAFIIPEDVVPPAVPDANTMKLERSNNDRLLSGVCAGLAARFELDPTVVRLLWITATLGSMGLGLAVYMLMTFIVPRAR